MGLKSKRRSNSPSDAIDVQSAPDYWVMEDVNGQVRHIPKDKAQKLVEIIKEDVRMTRKKTRALEKKKMKSLNKAARSLLGSPESDGENPPQEISMNNAPPSSSDEDEGGKNDVETINNNQENRQKSSAKKRKVNHAQGNTQEKNDNEEEAQMEIPMNETVTISSQNPTPGIPQEDFRDEGHKKAPMTETVSENVQESQMSGISKDNECKNKKPETKKGNHSESPKTVTVIENVKNPKLPKKSTTPDSDVNLIEIDCDQAEPPMTVKVTAEVHTVNHLDQGMKRLGPAGKKMNELRGINSPLNNKNTTPAPRTPANLTEAREEIKSRQAISIYGSVVPKRMMDALKRLDIKVAVEPLKHWTQIRVAKIEDHGRVFALLDELDIHGYTHSTEQSSSVTRIVLDIDGETDPQEIEEEILGKTGVVVDVQPMWGKNWYALPVDGKQPLKRINKFKVTAPNWEDMKKVQAIGIQYQAPGKVRWETPQKSDVTQCYRCQRFNHTSKLCRMPFRCVKCKESHEPGNCKNLKFVNGILMKAYCVNCGIHDHPANFRKCPHYIYAVETMKRRKAAQATLKNTKALAFAESAARIVNPQISFAEIAAMSLRMSQPPPPIPLTTNQQTARTMALPQKTDQAPAPQQDHRPATPPTTTQKTTQPSAATSHIPPPGVDRAQASTPLQGSPLDATYGGVPICLLLSKIDPYIPLLNECKTEDERGEIMIKLFTSIKLDIYRSNV